MAEVLRRFRYSPSRLSDSVSPGRKFEKSDSREKHVTVINKRKFNYLEQADIDENVSGKYTIGKTSSPNKVGSSVSPYDSAPVSWNDTPLPATLTTSLPS